MAVTVRIPAPLRRVTQGKALVELNCSSLSECIAELDAQFPGIKERLTDESGELRSFVNVYLNGEDIRFLKGLNTALKSGDEVSIVPAVAGGY
jgi:molybdopterin synthase sulfur carrier subunit